MSMTGEEFVAQEQDAAEAAGLSPRRADAPAYVYGERPKKVKLPLGWKPSSKKEVVAYLENLTKEERNVVMKLHFYAYFSEGGYTPMGKDAAVKFIRAYGLVVGPWHKHGFPGMCNSEELGKRRFAKAAQEENDQRSDDATMARLAKMGMPKEEMTHDKSYDEHVADDLLTAAFLHGAPMPKGRAVSKKVKEWLPTRVDVCGDCGWRRPLLRVEHAKGGPDDGKRRKPPCWADNIGERADCDAAIDAAYKADETLDEDACEAVPKSHFTTIPRLTGRFILRYAKILGLRLAFARPDDASVEDLAILAQAEALAADVRAPEDREALDYHSTLRRRPADDGETPTLEEKRASYREMQDARVAQLKKSRAASEAQRKALPPVRVGMRVVAKATGTRGVVLRTTGGGQWFRVEHENTSWGGTWEKSYRRLELDIDKSRKPAAKPSARKPAARKPAARKPAAKPAARKPSVRKSRK